MESKFTRGKPSRAISPSRLLVYLITNQVNGREYVGITTQSIKKRWRDHKAAAVCGSQTALHRAIRKYRGDKFVVTQIASGLSIDGLKAVEVALISQRGSKTPNGYNMTTGGDGTADLTHTPEARRKIGIASSRRVLSDSTRKLIGKAHEGKPLSAEHCAKLSAVKMGKKLPARTQEHCQKISDGLRRAHAKRREQRDSILLGARRQSSSVATRTDTSQPDCAGMGR